MTMIYDDDRYNEDDKSDDKNDVDNIDKYRN